MNQTGVVSTGSRLQARTNRELGADINHYRSILARCVPTRSTKAWVFFTRDEGISITVQALEEIGVGAGTNEVQIVAIDLVDQQPIGFDVAVAEVPGFQTNTPRPTSPRAEFFTCRCEKKTRS